MKTRNYLNAIDESEEYLKQIEALVMPRICSKMSCESCPLSAPFPEPSRFRRTPPTVCLKIILNNQLEVVENLRRTAKSIFFVCDINIEGDEEE